MSNVRTLSAEVLTAVMVDGQSLSTLMPLARNRLNQSEDGGLLQTLVYGVLRHYNHLAALCQPLLKKPLKTKDHDLYLLLLSAIYQLQWLDTPPHAVVNESVKAAQDLDKPWAKALINGVLRHFLREQVALNAKVSDKTQLNHPKWMMTKLKKQYPSQWQAICQANNAQPPIHIRHNPVAIDRMTFVAAFADQGIALGPVNELDGFYTLPSRLSIPHLPGFDQGWFSVQNPAAGLAGVILKPQGGERILDACAAPGGKTSHLLELSHNQAHVTALEVDAKRCDTLMANLQRLGLSAQVVATDAGQFHSEQLFDKILLDAPCSALGIIRRHPDIKFHRQAADILQLQQTQRKLLQHCWSLLKPGGLLLYATCSVLADENQQQMRWFLQQQTDAANQPLAFSWGQTTDDCLGWQCLPDDITDGFYYALLKKNRS